MRGRLAPTRNQKPETAVLPVLGSAHSVERVVGALLLLLLGGGAVAAAVLAVPVFHAAAAVERVGGLDHLLAELGVDQVVDQPPHLALELAVLVALEDD